MSSDLDEVITRMGRLSLSDLKKVQAMAGYLIAGKGKYDLPEYKEADEKEDEAFLFYSQLEHVLTNHGISVLSWGVFKNTAAHRELVKKLQIMQLYTEKYFNRLTRRNRQRLYRIYAGVIVDCIKNNPYMPLSVRTIMTNLHRVSEFMADAFPGYAENGLLPVVLNLVEDREVPSMEVPESRKRRRRK